MEKNHEHNEECNHEPEFDEDTQRKIQELQILEQGFQQILYQKEAFQLELNETNLSLNEVNKAKDEIFKIVGSVIIKTSKEDIEKDLNHKKELIDLRLKSLEKQEKEFSSKLEELKAELIKKISNK